MRKQILCAPDVFQYEVHTTTYEVFWQKMLKFYLQLDFIKDRRVEAQIKFHHGGGKKPRMHGILQNSFPELFKKSIQA